MDSQNKTAPDSPSNLQNHTATQEWKDLGLSSEIQALIDKAGFKNPTPVQSQTIPEALKGNDLIVCSQTGTGKTASFVLPIVNRFAGRRGCYTLILAPTREIAQQIDSTLQLFANPRGLSSAVLIGGISMSEDEKALQNYPDIIVGTPGRLCDHIDRGNLWLDYIETVVLDEADRMLSMGFADSLNKIMKQIPEKRQVLMYSATFLPSVEALARSILKNPKKFTFGGSSSAKESIEQKAIWLSEEDKKSTLLKLLKQEQGSVFIFTRSKDSAQQLWLYLHSQGVYDATYLSSDRAQAQREQALAEFKSGKHRILVATDVGGRGIHVDNVAHVVNYDLPMDPEDYVHRIGRTGRAEAKGRATSFVTGRDRKVFFEIEKLIGKKIPTEGAPPQKPKHKKHHHHPKQIRRTKKQHQ